MIPFLKKNLNSIFFQRSKIIFSGSLISQLVTFLTSFIITSYYLPSDLGLLGSLTALISIIAGTLSFRFEMAILKSSEEDSFDSFLKSVVIGGLACTLFCLLNLFLPWEFSKNISDNLGLFILWCWGYCFFFNSRQLPLKFNQLKFLALGNIYKSVSLFLLQLLMGLINPTFFNLLFARVASDYAGGFTHSFNFFHLFNLQKFKTNWVEFFRKNRYLILYTTPHHLLLSVSNNILILFLEPQFGLEIAGYFALASRLVMAPLEMLTTTVASVALQRFKELETFPSDLKSFYLKITFFSLLSTIFLSIIIFFSSDFFVSFLGEKWTSTSSIIKSLCPFLMSYLISVPTIHLLRFLERSRTQLLLELVEVILKLSFLVFYKTSSAEEVILIYGILCLSLSLIKVPILIKIISRNRINS
jgi:lipopolysaccharide exporter